MITKEELMAMFIMVLKFHEPEPSDIFDKEAQSNFEYIVQGMILQKYGVGWTEKFDASTIPSWNEIHLEYTVGGGDE